MAAFWNWGAPSMELRGLESYWLTCHPDTEQSALTEIRIWPGRKGTSWLSLVFRALGAMDQIEWPHTDASANGPWSRADRIWQHSCFEVFVSIPGETGYLEINLATNGLWAAYAFDGYRSGMQNEGMVILTEAYWRIDERRVQMTAVVELPERFRGRPLNLAASAVIESKDGTKSYWALAHPPGQPDFHHPTCFATTLPAPEMP